MAKSYLVDHLKTKRAAQIKRTALYEGMQIETAASHLSVEFRLVVHMTPPCLKKEVLLLGRAGRTTIWRRKVSQKYMLIPKLPGIKRQITPLRLHLFRLDNIYCWAAHGNNLKLNQITK